MRKSGLAPAVAVVVPAPDPLGGELLPPDLRVAWESWFRVLPVPGIGDDGQVRVQVALLLEPLEVLRHRTAVQPEQLGDGARIRSLTGGVEGVDRPKDAVLDVGQFGVRAKAVDGSGLELILPSTFLRLLPVEVLLLVRQRPQLLVGETVLLESLDDLGQGAPPFASGRRLPGRRGSS